MNIEDEYRDTMTPDVLRSWAQDAQKELRRLRELEENVEFILDNDPDTVRVCEGGGPENIAKSLAVTWVKKND